MKACKAHARSTGQRCRQPAMLGQDVCRYHGGATPQARAKAAQRLEAERQLARQRRVLDRRLGGSLEGDPSQALAELVAEGRANVAALRELVAELAPHPDPEALRDYRRALIAWQGERDGAPPQPPLALHGINHLGDGAQHVLVTMYADERKLLLAAAKAAGDLGVAERAQVLEESEAALIAQLIIRVLGDPDLGLAPELQQQARAIAAREILTLEAPQEERAA